MGFPFSITKIGREDHVAAAIRANSRDDRIRNVLVDSEDIRVAAIAQASRAMVLTDDSMAQLDVASEEARGALK
ncbi:MAG TPA: hypothetical protein VNM48_04920, partial [Chloroflexota bacterium]|nr:hypothetical protein [Chloroflexota bacterium]